MPHIIVEYPKALENIGVQELLKELHDTLCTHDTIVRAAIKTRAISFEDCVVGENADENQCVHITLRLLPGRSMDMRKSMALSLKDKAQELISDSYPECAVTAEVVELDAETYIK